MKKKTKTTALHSWLRWYIIMLLCVRIVLYNNLFYDVYQCYYIIDIEIHWFKPKLVSYFYAFCFASPRMLINGLNVAWFIKKTMLYQFPDIFSLNTRFSCVIHYNKISTYTLYSIIYITHIKLYKIQNLGSRVSAMM